MLELFKINFMPIKNLHDKPFDETTLVKLDIFEKYAQAWIPTFVMTPNVKTICIFDFFAGTGYDQLGKEGSPIRLLNKIKEQINNVKEKNVIIQLYLNEFDNKKHSELVEAVKNYIDEFELGNFVKLEIENKDFDVCFFEQLEKIRKLPSLVYLDQNGVKFLREKYFNEFLTMKQTDFLYFASSSYLKRLGEEPEFQGVIEDLSLIKSSKVHESHRILVEEMKKKIPSNSMVKLYPFSLKKTSGVFGIMFGASHYKAVEIFLNLGWKINSMNGQANYDIDDDLQKTQGNLFEDPKLTKLQAFEKKLTTMLLNGELKSNKDTLEFCYSEGHIGRKNQVLHQHMNCKELVKP